MTTYEQTAQALAGGWAAAGRRMVAKTLAELSYEGLLEPRETAPGRYEVALPGGVTWAFAARPRLLDRLQVQPGTATRDGAPADDPLQLLRDLAPAAGMNGATTGHLHRELSNTLVADCLHAAGPAATADELLDLDYPWVEGEMTGHPWIVFNKGRIGFSTDDVRDYAPESTRPFHLPWLAVARERATFVAVDGLDHERLIAEELDPADVAAFRERLAVRGLDPGGYHWFPVHPWQWRNVVVPQYGPELAAGALVPLGESRDLYLPQQAIRTLSNISTPGRRHVKLPLSVLNTLVWRGLPSDRTVTAPQVTAWLREIRDGDPFLAEEHRVVLPGEVAGVDVPHRGYAAVPGAPYQYHELLGCIWREPVTSFLDPGEQAITMAALLHVDRDGRSVLAAMVERAGLPPREWLARLFHTLLPPLLHFLYRYGVVFSPHGQNAILAHRDGLPSRLVVKDFVDDVNVSDQPLPELAGLPEALRSVLLSEPPAWLCQFLQAGLFVGHFRYLSDLAEDHLGVPELQFWGLVRAEILAHQARFPELAERFALFDLLAPDFVRICLNRNRLLLDTYADRPERPHAATHGRVPNPLAEAAVPAPAAR